MKRCIIVGAGGFGREVLSWALHVRQDEWKVAGFLDSDLSALDGKNTPYPILGDPGTWAPGDDEVFLAAIGDPASRLRVCLNLQARGAHFITLIHPSVIRALNVEIGEGTVICPNVVLGANVTLGAFVLVNLAATLGHDCQVGTGTTISCHCDVMGYVSVGRECFLGGHCCIVPKRKVEDYSIVGAGSAVFRNVAAGTTVVGVPAHVLVSGRERQA